MRNWTFPIKGNCGGDEFIGEKINLLQKKAGRKKN
jgi:hypothetical protein